MPQTLAQKFRLKPGQALLLLRAPSGFEDRFQPLPGGVRLSNSSRSPDQVHWFAENRAALEKDWERVRKLFKPDLLLWIYFPKASSGRQSDLTRDKGWDCLDVEKNNLAWLGLYSFDDTWSVAGYRIGKVRPAEKKKPVVPGTAEWINPVTREVKIPPDLEAAFRKHKKEAALFSSMSYTHRKEYVEWIVTAKKPETRARRVEGVIALLEKKSAGKAGSIN